MDRLHEARDEKDYRFLFSDLNITGHSLLICSLNLQNRFSLIQYVVLRHGIDSRVYLALMTEPKSKMANPQSHIFWCLSAPFFVVLSVLCLCWTDVGVLVWDTDSCLYY